MSTGGQKELLSSGLRFLNKFMDTAGSSQKRLYIQAELDQAGLDISVIKKACTIQDQFPLGSQNLDYIFQNISNSAGFEGVLDEIHYWEKKNINIENLTYVLGNFKKENAALREKVGLLERKMQVIICWYFVVVLN